MGNVIVKKSKNFSVKIVNLYKEVSKKNSDFVLSKQILKSGTSIGANVIEGTQAESKRDFIHKMSIALKEASETMFWLEMLKEAEFLDEQNFHLLQKDLSEVIALLTSIIKTAKANLLNN